MTFWLRAECWVRRRRRPDHRIGLEDSLCMEIRIGGSTASYDDSRASPKIRPSYACARIRCRRKTARKNKLTLGIARFAPQPSQNSSCSKYGRAPVVSDAERIARSTQRELINDQQLQRGFRHPS